MPALGIPLRAGEVEPLLQLQPLVHRVYDKSRFELAIDYQTKLTPQPSLKEQEWVKKSLIQIS